MLANFFYLALLFFASVTHVASAPASVSASTSLSARSGGVIETFDREVVAITKATADEVDALLGRFATSETDLNARIFIAGEVAEAIRQESLEIVSAIQRVRDAISPDFNPLLENGANEVVFNVTDMILDVLVAFSNFRQEQIRQTGAPDFDENIVILLNTLQQISAGTTNQRIAQSLISTAPSRFQRFRAEPFRRLVRTVLPQSARTLSI